MATLKDTIVLGNLSTTGTLNATTIYEGGTSLVDKYAAKSHTHGYLPLTGGVLTGNLCFKEISNGTFPVTSSGIVWNGSTDNAAIFYRLDAADAGRLVFRTGDDTNCNFVWNNTSSGDIMQLTGAGELTVKGTSHLSNVNCNGNITLSHITGADPDGTIKTRYIKNIDFKVNEGSSTAEFPLSISSETNLDLNASNSLDISSGSYMWLSAGGAGNNNSIDMDDEGIRLSTKGVLSLECGNFKTIANNSYLGGIKPWYSTTGSSKYNNGTTAPSAGSDSPNINGRSTTTGRYYAVEMDADGRAYVNVPWVDTDTHIAVDSHLSASSTNPLQNKAIYSAFSSAVGYDADYYYFGGYCGSWRTKEIEEDSAYAYSLDIRYGTITINSQSSTYNASFNKKSMNNANYTVVFGLKSDSGKQSWFWSPIVLNKGTSGFTVFLRGNSSGDNAGTIMYIAIRINSGNN